MAVSLMLALPGTPVIWYGDEIGMGDNLDLPERKAVRTPMQWTSGPNGGFSTAPAEDCVRQPVGDGPFSYAHVHANGQRIDRESLFSIAQRLIRARRGATEIGWGDCRVVDTGETSVVALVSTWRGGRVLTLHNLADRPVTIDCTEIIGDAKASSLLNAGIDISRSEGETTLRLAAFGYDWLRLG